MCGGFIGGSRGCLAAATPAFAQDIPYSTFGAELDSGVLDDAELVVPAAYSGTVDLTGGLSLALDRTPLDVLTRSFDVAPQTYQHVGYTTTWVCFTDAGRRVWYIADLTYETRDDIYVSQIIDEPADPATDAIFRCRAEPGAMLARQFALPAVGATLAQLNEFYGAQLPEGTRYVGAHSDTTGADPYPLSKIVYYRLASGTVDAISIAGGDLADSP